MKPSTVLDWIQEFKILTPWQQTNVYRTLQPTNLTMSQSQMTHWKSQIIHPRPPACHPWTGQTAVSTNQHLLVIPGSKQRVDRLIDEVAILYHPEMM